MQPPSFAHSFGEPCGVEPGAAQGPHQASKMPLLVPAIGAVTGASQVALSFLVGPTCPSKFLKRRKALSSFLTV